MSDDDEEEFYGGLYDEGHWVWSETEKGLVFVSDKHIQEHGDIQILINTVPTGTIEFRDDLDLLEQDVKDIALYTAPVNILSPALINMLHISTTERFIRALILFCQYYLQVEEQMALRMLETETKIRTPDCEIIERKLQDNLADLRLLVAKEYSIMMIELEVNRIFKSEIFNAVEHRLETSYIAKMSEEQRSVLLGHCVRRDGKLNSCSPLRYELSCERPIDYRLLGLGVIKYPNLTIRMTYLMLAIAGPEDILTENGVVLGIIGMHRKGFDTMLQPIFAQENVKSKASMSMTRSNASSFSKSSNVPKALYPEVDIPPKDKNEALIQPPLFSEEQEDPRPCSQKQKLRWQKRLVKILHPQSASHII